jgi:hypothetical protein
VGPCASGKTTLGRRLRGLGYEVHEPAQEHSCVPDLWRRRAVPDALIYLEVSLAVTRRRDRAGWPQFLWEEQHQRLAHARRHCDCYLLTDELTPEQVLQHVLAFLQLTDHKVGDIIPF